MCMALQRWFPNGSSVARKIQTNSGILVVATLGNSKSPLLVKETKTHVPFSFIHSDSLCGPLMWL